MARITMRKVQETKLSEVFTLYLASAAARGVKDKTLRTYEQHFNAISKRLDVDGNISLITSKELDKMILKMREDGCPTVPSTVTTSCFFIVLHHKKTLRPRPLDGDFCLPCEVIVENHRETCYSCMVIMSFE